MTAPNAPMSAANALRIISGDGLGGIEAEARFIWDTKDADAINKSAHRIGERARAAADWINKVSSEVAAMAEREAETSRALTVSLNVVKRLQAERDALVKEVEALRADAERLDWFDKNGFTAYRQIDPIDGISSHCVVVHETQKPRRGNVADGIRAAIDAARAEARDG